VSAEPAAALSDALFGVPTTDPRALAVRAYVWGFPLVAAAQIRLRGTNPDDPLALRPPVSTGAPINAWGHSRVPADPSYRAGVGINVDTLYSSARLDLADGPFLVTSPDFADRYYTFQYAFADSSAELSIGQRTHGGQLPPVFVAGPGDTTPTPSGALEVRSPTRYLLISGRLMFRHDDGDLAAVHRQQDALTVRTWASVLDPGAPSNPISPQRRLVDPHRRIDPALGFLEQLGNVLRDWVVAADDRDLVSSFGRIGLSVTEGFRPDRLSAPDVAEVATGLAEGREVVRRASLQLGETVDGWTTNLRGCRFGGDHLLRAAVARDQIFVTVPEEAIYPVGRTDSEGRPLEGDSSYRIRFAADALPPASAFWSMTMYDDDGWLVDNPLGRYAVGDRTQDLVTGADGAVEVLLSRRPAAPGEPGNWLPAPAGRFYVMLRLYLPGEAALHGRWRPPPIVRVQRG
jgi:hypothetical protein